MSGSLPEPTPPASFRDERATPVVLEFLEDTRVGRVPGLALMGVVEEESDLEELELWPEDVNLVPYVGRGPQTMSLVYGMKSSNPFIPPAREG